jgi:hypothetical protein
MDVSDSPRPSERKLDGNATQRTTKLEQSRC